MISFKICITLILVFGFFSMMLGIGLGGELWEMAIEERENIENNGN